MQPRFSALIITSIAALALAHIASEPPKSPGTFAELQVSIHERDIPSRGGHLHDPAVGPDAARSSLLLDDLIKVLRHVRGLCRAAGAL